MKKALPAVYILVAAVLWGCIGLFYKQLAAFGFSQLQVVLLRVVTAAVLMAGYMLLRDPSWFRIRLRDLWMFIGTGIISLAFFNYCYFGAMDELSVSVAATLLYTAPIFVMLMSSLLFRERLTCRKLTALVLTFCGCVLVTGALGAGEVTLFGLLLGLGSGIGYAFYSIFGAYALRRYRTETVTFYTFLLASVSVLPMCHPSSVVEIVSKQPFGVISGTLGIGCLACLLPYLFYTKGLEGVTPGQASVMATLEPVVATVIGVVAFGDPMSPMKCIGMLLIIAAICLLNVKKSPERA